MQMKIKKVGECHSLPQQANSGERCDVGYDVVADVATVVTNDGRELSLAMCLENKCSMLQMLLHTNNINYIMAKANYVAYLDDDDYHIEALANSRISKGPLFMKNGIGLIDPGFMSPIQFRYGICTQEALRLINTAESWLPMVGKVCGQLVIRKTYHADVVEVDELLSTDRGEGGFGSTEEGDKENETSTKGKKKTV